MVEQLELFSDVNCELLQPTWRSCSETWWNSELELGTVLGRGLGDRDYPVPTGGERRQG